MKRDRKSGSRPKEVIFRRYRRGRDGKVLDAHDYGIKAWPFHISR